MVSQYNDFMLEIPACNAGAYREYLVCRETFQDRPCLRLPVCGETAVLRSLLSAFHHPLSVRPSLPSSLPPFPSAAIFALSASRLLIPRFSNPAAFSGLTRGLFVPFLRDAIYQLQVASATENKMLKNSAVNAGFSPVRVYFRRRLRCRE